MKRKKRKGRHEQGLWDRLPTTNGIDVNDHLGLVGWIVKRMSRNASERDRVESEAMVGLYYAARYWNHRGGGSFANYAIECMKGFVNAAREFESRLRVRRVSWKGVARVQHLCLFSELGSSFVGGNANIFAVESEDCNRSDMRELVAAVGDALKTLPLRHRTVLSLRYGLSDSNCYTLAETGRILGITQERVRQIEINAKRKLLGESVSPLFRPFAETEDELKMLA